MKVLDPTPGIQVSYLPRNWKLEFSLPVLISALLSITMCTRELAQEKYIHMIILLKRNQIKDCVVKYLFSFALIMAILIYLFVVVSLYVAVTLASIFVNGSVPLFYEISCELCYPQPEGIVGGFLTVLNNIFGILFLLVLDIPHIGKG